LWRLHRISDPEIEAVILGSLEGATLGNGLTAIMRLATGFPTTTVRKMLLRCAVQGHDSHLRFQAAELVDFLYGGSPSLWDSASLPLHRRFSSSNRSEREDAYRELCAKNGIDPWLEERSDA